MSMSLSRSRFIYRAWLALACGALLMLGTGACGGGCGDAGTTASSTKTTSKKVGALSSRVPSDVSFVMLTPSIDGFRSSYESHWKTLNESFKGEKADSARLLTANSMKELQASLAALDIEKSGVDLDGPLMATVHGDGNTGILMARVSDKKALNAFIPKMFEGDEVSKKKVDGTTIRTLAPKGKRKVPVSWTYDGSTVAVAAPGRASDGATKRLHEDLKGFLKSRKTKQSLKGTSGFETFRKSLVDEQSVAVYVNTEKYQKTFDGFVQSFCRTPRYDSEKCSKLTDQIEGAGVAMNMPSKGHARVRGWLGWTSKGTNWLKKATKASRDFDWKRFATEDTHAATRLSVNLDTLLEGFKYTLSPKYRKSFTKIWGTLKRRSGGKFEFKRDILGTLSGEAGVFVYDVGEMAGGPGMAAMSSRYLMVMPVRKKAEPKKALQNVAALMAPNIPGELDIHPLETTSGKVEGIQVAEIAGTPMAAASIPKAYITDDAVMLASGAFSPEEMRDIVKGKRDTAALSKASSIKLGGPFADASHLTGLYLNVEKTVDTLKPKLKPVPDSSWSRIESLREMSLTTDVDDRGMFVSFETTFDPKSTLDKIKELGGPSEGGTLQKIDDLQLDSPGGPGSGSPNLQKQQLDTPKLNP